MILAHLSDLHLGFRAYHRMDRGRNVRERDVADAFGRAVDRLVEISPDVILIAGDVFDRPDPSPAALVALTRGLERLASECEAPIAIVAGARDTPRRPGDPGALSALEGFPHVEVALAESRRLSLAGGRIGLTMLPYRAALREPDVSPSSGEGVRWNVLLAHAGRARKESSAIPLRAAEWDYVALGSSHEAAAIRPHVRYSGSLERIGPAPWREAALEKGFLTWDLEKGSATFHPVAVRPVVALAPTRVPAGGPGRLLDRLREVIEEVPGGVEDKIVHLTLRGITHGELIGLQGDLLASLRARALHLSIDFEERRERAVDLDVRGRLRAELEGAGYGTRRHLSVMDEMLAGGGLGTGAGH